MSGREIGIVRGFSAFAERSLCIRGEESLNSWRGGLSHLSSIASLASLFLLNLLSFQNIDLRRGESDTEQPRAQKAKKGKVKGRTVRFSGRVFRDSFIFSSVGDVKCFSTEASDGSHNALFSRQNER